MKSSLTKNNGLLWIQAWYFVHANLNVEKDMNGGLEWVTLSLTRSTTASKALRLKQRKLVSTLTHRYLFRSPFKWSKLHNYIIPKELVQKWWILDELSPFNFVVYFCHTTIKYNNMNQYYYYYFFLQVGLFISYMMRERGNFI